MALIQLNNETFDDIINNNEIVVIDFWAQWCAPCLSFAPTYEEVAAEYPDIVFTKINVEEEAELAQEFNIRSIPTIMIFRQQIIVFSEAGSISREAFVDLIHQAQALNMEEVLSLLKEESAS